MNSKDIKKYALVNALLNSWASRPELADLIGELAVIDFPVAFEVWEYILHTFQKDLADVKVAENAERKVFATFNNLSEVKTRQLFVESSPLIKLVYSMSATSATGTNLAFIANLILSSKTDSAEDALRCVAANKTPSFDYGARMKDILDAVFETYCKTKGVKKVELSRKQSKMLLEYIAKIKGPYKLLLTQRVKEL